MSYSALPKCKHCGKKETEHTKYGGYTICPKDPKEVHRTIYEPEESKPIQLGPLCLDPDPILDRQKG